MSPAHGQENPPVMSRLLALIDDYKDRHGQPSDASVARAIKISPQALNAWRRRGIRELPKAETLQELARLLGVGDEVTFHAAGVDAGYIRERTEPQKPQEERTG